MAAKPPITPPTIARIFSPSGGLSEPAEGEGRRDVGDSIEAVDVEVKLEDIDEDVKLEDVGDEDVDEDDEDEDVRPDDVDNEDEAVMPAEELVDTSRSNLSTQTSVPSWDGSDLVGIVSTIVCISGVSNCLLYSSDYIEKFNKSNKNE